MADSRLITKRDFIKLTPATLAAASLPAIATAAEEPVDKVTRLSRELATALNDYANGSMHAIVYPSTKRRGVEFRISDMYISPGSRVLWAAEQLETAITDASGLPVKRYSSLSDTGHVYVFVTERGEV